MEIEPIRVETVSGISEQTPANDRERIIALCYDLVCAGRPLTEIVYEAKRLSDLTKSGPSYTEASNLHGPPATVPVKQISGIRLLWRSPRWLVATTCSAVLTVMAAIAVVTHLPAAEATSSANTSSSTDGAPAIVTSFEFMVVPAENRRDAVSATSSEQRASQALTPISNLVEDVGREHPLTTADNFVPAEGTTGCPCPVHRQPRSRVPIVHSANAPPQAMVGTPGRDYNPVIPNPHDSAYDRLVSEHFRNRVPSGFHESADSKEIADSKSGIIPYRVVKAGRVLQYDGLLGRYVPLARGDGIPVAAATRPRN